LFGYNRIFLPASSPGPGKAEQQHVFAALRFGTKIAERSKISNSDQIYFNMKKSFLPESQKSCKKKVQLIATTILDIVPKGSQVILMYRKFTSIPHFPNLPNPTFQYSNIPSFQLRSELFGFDFITALFVRHNVLNMDKKMKCTVSRLVMKTKYGG
jgi:hypothetical protein